MTNKTVTGTFIATEHEPLASACASSVWASTLATALFTADESHPFFSIGRPHSKSRGEKRKRSLHRKGVVERQ